MIPKIIVYTRKRTLGCFLIGLYQTNWLVVTIALNHCRVYTRPIIIVVRLLSDLGAGWVSREVVNTGLLHKGCIGTTTVAGWPAMISPLPSNTPNIVKLSPSNEPSECSCSSWYALRTVGTNENHAPAPPAIPND